MWVWCAVARKIVVSHHASHSHCYCMVKIQTIKLTTLVGYLRRCGPGPNGTTICVEKYLVLVWNWLWLHFKCTAFSTSNKKTHQPHLHQVLSHPCQHTYWNNFNWHQHTTFGSALFVQVVLLLVVVLVVLVVLSLSVHPLSSAVSHDESYNKIVSKSLFFLLKSCLIMLLKLIFW